MIDPRALPLLSASAVRSRSRLLFAAGLAGRLSHFDIHMQKIDDAAAYVIETMHLNYPDGNIPFHARWRHFDTGGIDRWGALAATFKNKRKLGRAAFDLAIVSVLLDAGAGPDWSYKEEETGQTHARSEGLGVASLRMFEAGVFSASTRDKLRCDGTRLAEITAKDIAAGFQVTKKNPLAGLEGRAALIRSLGRTVMGPPDSFMADGERPRPGNLLDRLVRLAGEDHMLAAPAILEALLVHLGPIWPGRTEFHDTPLGDTWMHPVAHVGSLTDGFVPFHKLSQWLAYSLIEPLQWAGIEVVEIDGLTGLPEYRNGGLLIDLGVITLRNAAEAEEAHEPGSRLVVEWRALTVALLDLVADRIRAKLGETPVSLPLAKILEGGTWSAGRRIAAEKRSGGGPPLAIVSDGTVF
jgi:Protein of unknown function (DUF1688)